MHCKICCVIKLAEIGEKMCVRKELTICGKGIAFFVMCAQYALYHFDTIYLKTILRFA